VNGKKGVLGKMGVIGGRKPRGKKTRGKETKGRRKPPKCQK
jgi:hypothetical protein